MGYVFQKVVWTLVQPSNLLLLLLSVGVALLWTRRARLGRRLLMATLLALLLIGVSPLADWVTSPLEDYFPSPEPLPGDIAGMVVLGGAEQIAITLARGRPSLNASAERLIAAAALAERYPDAQIVFTGGGAEVAQAFFVQFGIEPPRLLLEDASRDTFENAQLSWQLVQPGAQERWLLITSARHMPRSLSTFRAAGWQVLPYPVDYRTSGQDPWFPTRRPLERLVLLDQALTEWLGLLAYRLAGRSERLLPER